MPWGYVGVQLMLLNIFSIYSYFQPFVTGSSVHYSTQSKFFKVWHISETYSPQSYHPFCCSPLSQTIRRCMRAEDFHLSSFSCIYSSCTLSFCSFEKFPICQRYSSKRLRYSYLRPHYIRGLCRLHVQNIFRAHGHFHNLCWRYHVLSCSFEKRSDSGRWRPCRGWGMMVPVLLQLKPLLMPSPGQWSLSVSIGYICVEVFSPCWYWGYRTAQLPCLQTSWMFDARAPCCTFYYWSQHKTCYATCSCEHLPCSSCWELGLCSVHCRRSWTWISWPKQSHSTSGHVSSTKESHCCSRMLDLCDEFPSPGARVESKARRYFIPSVASNPHAKRMWRELQTCRWAIWISSWAGGTTWRN